VSSARLEAAQPLAKRSGARSVKIGLTPHTTDGTHSQIPCRPLHISAFASFGPAFNHSVSQAVAQASANCPNHSVVKLQNTSLTREDSAQSARNLVRSDQRQLAYLQQTRGIGVGMILGMENFLVIHQTTVSN